MRQSADLEDRVFGALLGAAVGDAIGLPFEGAPRQWLDDAPVDGITGGGPHRQPAGNWSDDTSLLLCLADSLCGGYDPDDVGARFLAWWREGLWTPQGRAFGYGHTVAASMNMMIVGIPALKAGQDSEGSNANGSLMRTLPVGLYFSGDTEKMLAAAHQVSSISHAHPRSLMCCGIYCLISSCLLEAQARAGAVQEAVGLADDYYRGPPWDEERPHLARVLSLEVADLHRSEVRSGAYVVETLEAAVWAFLRGESFREALLTAVNLGGDTDTVGCLAGGLAGAFYGRSGIPPDWIEGLARAEDILALCGRFLDAIRARRNV